MTPRRAAAAGPTAAGLAAQVARNLVVGLAVSFVALSLGAAFGILSGRGAFAGMVSAGIISLVTGLLGGTRVQCSGPTAPMSVVTAAIVAVAFDRIPEQLPGVAPDHFVNLVILLAAGLLLTMALLRLGRFIRLVPNVVVSGFMNGVALLIWAGQVTKLAGLGGHAGFDGPLAANVGIAAVTLALAYLYPAAARRLPGHASRLLPPATLAVLVAVTLAVHGLQVPVGRVVLGGSVAEMGGVLALVAAQWPADWSGRVLALALPFALQLAVLCYLDTLLTSLVIDRMTGEPTRQNRELAAQGLANGAVALVGGIPGAQATVRSVLVVKEGATLRLAGIAIGGFVLLEMVLLQEWIALIPQAAFAGILLKVGCDVLDVHPLAVYARRLAGRPSPPPAVFVSHLEMLIIAGTTLTTVFLDLNVAVVAFTAIFYLINRVLRPDDPIRDLQPHGRVSAED